VGCVGSAGSEEEDVRGRLRDGWCSSSSSSWVYEDDGAGEGNEMGVEWEKRLGLINVDVVVVEDIIDNLLLKLFLLGGVVEVKEGTEGREGLRKRKMDCGGEDVEVSRIRGPVIYQANKTNRGCTAPTRSLEGGRWGI